MVQSVQYWVLTSACLEYSRREPDSSENTARKTGIYIHDEPIHYVTKGRIRRRDINERKLNQLFSTYRRGHVPHLSSRHWPPGESTHLAAAFHWQLYRGFFVVHLIVRRPIRQNEPGHVSWCAAPCALQAAEQREKKLLVMTDISVIFYFTRPRRFFAMKELLQKVLRTRSGIIMERQKEGRYT